VIKMDFEALLKKTMGLDSASVGSSTIDRAVRSRMAGTGISRLDDYWQQVCSSKDELQELIETVVVPETWFFRDREAFVGLVRLAREEWLPTHGGGVLRGLSIPCSTGEEPYSMVIALLEGGFPREAIQIDAIDISERALARARHGEYGLNSFRGSDLAFRDRYFKQTSRGYSLEDWIPNMVTFRRGNLLSPELSFRPEPYDVVFCRNLLIYFDRATQEQAMRTLRFLLVSAGFLFVGGAETYLASRSGFTSVNHVMSFAFRKTGAKQPKPDPQIPLFRPNSRRTIPLRPNRPLKEGPSAVAVPFSPVELPGGLETARRLADSGRLQEAAEWCEADIRQTRPSPETYFLLGIVRDALGDGPRAAECYRKLLYLDPEHEGALTHLALLTEKMGDVSAAGLLRQRIRRIELLAKPE